MPMSGSLPEWFTDQLDFFCGSVAEVIEHVHLSKTGIPLIMAAPDDILGPLGNERG